jgi:integrase
MTPDEIARIMDRLDTNDADHDKIYRMLYLIIGVALGTGALTLSQVVGL